jgi:peptidoglycan hydrolase-like protein with peptidoglycan-binding domain
MVLEDGANASSEASSNTTTSTSTQKVSDTKMPTIKKGSTGKVVKVWQIIVGAEADGDFGSKTKTATIEFQRKYKLVQDGIVGENTWKVGLESL